MISRRVGAGGPGPLLSSERNWGSLSSSRNCSARQVPPAQGSRSGRKSEMGKRKHSVALGAERRTTVCCSGTGGVSVWGVDKGHQSCPGLLLPTHPRPVPAGHLTSRPVGGGSLGETLAWRSRKDSRCRAPSSKSAWKGARSRASSEWQRQAAGRWGRLWG